MEPITLTALAAAVGGRLVRAADPDVRVGKDVVIDSRLVTPGALFVAFAGERVDGHDFLVAAAGAGAAAALVSREVDVALPQVVVDETVEGLSRLARAVVDNGAEHGLVVVGVTGSSGKTSTKDLIAQVLGASAPTVAPPGSFNNEIGAPLTACRVDARTKFLVSEMGARGVGHIRHLAGITPPAIGAVLNVGSAHVGEFGSVEAIARAKGELVEALGPDGWAVLNADDPLVSAMATRTSAHLAAFSLTGEPVDVGGHPAELRVWADDITADDLQRFSFVLHASRVGADTHRGDIREPNVTGVSETPVSVEPDRAPVTLRVLGRHNVANALAAAAVGLAAGLELDAVASALSAATPLSRWRMELTTRSDGLAILNDAYNANPDSMAAALHSLAAMRRPGGRLIAVLGTMLELGEASADAHRTVGELAADLGIDEVLAVGDHGDNTVAGVAARGGHGQYQDDKDQLAAVLNTLLGPRDVVLVKASRGLALETVVAALASQDEGDTHP